MSVLDALAERVARGEGLSAEDARSVLASYDLIAIGMMGDEVRRRRHAGRTTFARVFEMHVDAPPPTMPPRAVAGEVRIIGRPASVEAAEAAVRAARQLAGNVPVTGFALAEVVALAQGAQDLRQVFTRLRSAGLDAIAELAIDESPDPAAAVHAARDAGVQVLRLTLRSLPPQPDGSAEVDAQIGILERACALQESVGGFRAYAPLPRTMSVTTPTTGYDDVKLIALARLMVTNIETIQVDWPLYGPKLAQVGLTVGADDVDGVAAVDVGTLGARRSALEDIRRNIRAAALEPVERDGLFRTQ